MSIFFRCALFLAAFLPVNLIVLLRAAQQCYTPGIVVFLCLSLLGVILNVFVAGRLLSRADGEYYTIIKYNIAEDNVLFYVVSVVPIFVSAQFEDPYSVSIFVLVYFLICVVCVTSKYINVNPVLYIFGIRYFEARAALLGVEKDVVLVSTRNRMREGGRMRLANMKGTDWYLGLT